MMNILHDYPVSGNNVGNTKSEHLAREDRMHQKEVEAQLGRKAEYGGFR